jgi:hypothetical protein
MLNDRNKIKWGPIIICNSWGFYLKKNSHCHVLVCNLVGRDNFNFFLPSQTTRLPFPFISFFFLFFLLFSPLLLYFRSSPALISFSFFPFLFLSSLPLLSVTAAAPPLFQHLIPSPFFLLFHFLPLLVSLPCTHTHTSP